MNDEISNLKSSINIQHDTINGIDTFLKNTIGSNITLTSSTTLNGIFPLKTETEIERFEEKIKGDKIFRNNVVPLHLPIIPTLYRYLHNYDRISDDL